MFGAILTTARESYGNTVDQFRGAFRRGTIEGDPLERLVFILSLAVVMIVSLVPVYILVMTSVVEDAALYDIPPTVVPTPDTLTTSHFETVLGPETFPFFTYFTNSLIVATVTSALGVLAAIFGGYSFARLDYPGRTVISRLVLVVYLFAGIILVVPLFQIMVWLDLVDTLTSLVVTYMVQVLPLSLYMLGNYFRSIPEEIEEAALVDGYSRVETIVRITIPLSAPAIVAVFLYSFMIAWNEYLFASIFLKTQATYTLPIGIESLTLTYDQAWGQVLAASLLTSIPIIIIFLYLEKYMIEGLTMGAVEG